MDIYTKVFLINILVLFIVQSADGYFFKGFIKNSKLLFPMILPWFFTTMLSIPVYSIYLIITW